MSTEGIPDWERRFRAPAVTLPTWSPMAPDRFTFTSNAIRRVSALHAWDSTRGRDPPAGDRGPRGYHRRNPHPDGSEVVWFHDAKGDEFGHHLVAPFESGGRAEPLIDGIPNGWPAGIA